MEYLCEKLAEAALCTPCPSESGTDCCMYKQQSSGCEELQAAIKNIKEAIIWKNYIIAKNKGCLSS